MHDSELIKRYTLDRAGIMFLTNLIWDANISDNMQKCHSAEMLVIPPLTKWSYLATGKMQLCSSDDLGLLQHLCCCSFPIKYVKYDSVVNKK